MPTLGILMLETRFPRPRGDIGHPRTFAFPTRRRIVEGASPERIVRGVDAALLAPFIAAAHELVAQGCDAIATSCGFLARWQRELQAALPVPVWSSALLQLAEEQAQGRRCGVITIIGGLLALHKSDGSFDGAVAISLDVHWIDYMMRTSNLPKGAVVAVFDRAGKVLATNNKDVGDAIARSALKDRAPGQISSAVDSRGDT